MAAEVQSLAQVKLQAKPSAASPEQIYWKSFKSPVKHKSPTKQAVTHIAQPITSGRGNASEYFAVTTGTRIQLFSVKSRKLIKTISRFEDIAHSGELRYDGRVLVAGDDSGKIQAFDVNSRAILKTWQEQKQPVHVTKWHPRDPTSLMSCGDDNTVRLWDLPTDSSVTTFRGHHDYVRAGCFLPGPSSNSNILVSGSYDNTVRLWDARVPQSPVMTFEHSASIEAVLAMPSGTTLMASAQNEVAVLDIVAGKPVHMLRNHQKTVTSMCLAQDSTRLVTGALDGHLKIFETTSWNYVAGTKYSNAILSVAVINGSSPTSSLRREDKHIAVGLADGTLSIKTRLSGEQKAKERERAEQDAALIAGTLEEYDRKKAKLAQRRGRGWEKRLRGRDFDGDGADIIVEGNDRSRASKKKPKAWDTALHQNRYTEALDTALASDQSPTVLAVLHELRYRSAMRAALENRNEVSLRPVLVWLVGNISTSSYTEICVETAMTIMDVYASQIWSSDIVAGLVEKLHKRVKDELNRAQMALSTKGMLELCVPEIRSVC